MGIGDGDSLFDPSGVIGDLFLLNLDGVEDGGGLGVLLSFPTGISFLPFSETKSTDEYFRLGQGMPSALKDIFRCLMDSTSQLERLYFQHKK